MNGGPGHGHVIYFLGPTFSNLLVILFFCLFHLPTKENVAFIHSIKLEGEEIVHVKVLHTCPVTREPPKLLPENFFFANQLWSTSFMKENRVQRLHERGCRG